MRCHALFARHILRQPACLDLSPAKQQYCCCCNQYVILLQLLLCRDDDVDVCTTDLLVVRVVVRRSSQLNLCTNYRSKKIRAPLHIYMGRNNSTPQHPSRAGRTNLRSVNNINNRLFPSTSLIGHIPFHYKLP